MKEVHDLFSVSTVTPEGLSLIGKGGNPGFRVPIYQRSYDWDDENVLRLVTSMFAGLERLCDSKNADAYTFLGSVILVEEETQEPTFKGKSFAVVDGQQRITTLSLLACALIERLRILHSTLPPSVSPRIRNWFDAEIDYIERSLVKSVVGKQEIKGDKTFAFPRITRPEDIRGTSIKEQELQSSISKFLVEFNRYYSSEEKEFEFPNLDGTRESRKIIANYSYIKVLLDGLNDPEWNQTNDCKYLEPESFCHGGLPQLLEKLKVTFGADGQQAISYIEKNEDFHCFFRTLLLSGYLCNCVAITVVTTEDETAAFDIFDALNTTGEPLTALEVLKPVVVSYLDNEASHPGFQNSDAERAFKEIGEIFEDDLYTDSQAKQDETKRIIVTVTLAVAGKKIAEKLSIQRAEIRKYFALSREAGANTAEQFVTNFASIARFRHDYWNDKQFRRLNIIHTDSAECEELKLVFGFLTAMKTSMAIPVLYRFWKIGSDQGNFSIFLEAARAVAAFVALRRAATEKTEDIDACFRDLMAEPTGGKRYGFCTGTTFSNPVPTIAELKMALKKSLASPKLKFGVKGDKARWVAHCSDVPIYNAAQPLARFLLLAAHHKTGVDPAGSHLPKRDGRLVDEEREFLSFAKWSDPRYQSVEHIAPNTDGAEGWNKEVLANVRIRNSLGNLTLLPVKENTHISNADWEKKSLFYAALAAGTVEKRKSQLEHAQSLNKPFKKTTWGVVNNSARLSILEGISEVDEWSKDLIEERSQRLLDLAWDEIWDWLEP